MDLALEEIETKKRSAGGNDDDDDDNDDDDDDDNDDDDDEEPRPMSTAAAKVARWAGVEEGRSGAVGGSGDAGRAGIMRSPSPRFIKEGFVRAESRVRRRYVCT